MGDAPKVLLVRPVINSYPYPRDLFEALSFSMGLLIKEQILKTDFTVVDLPAHAATKKAFQEAFDKYSRIELVVFLGHGERDGSCARGQYRQSLADQSNLGKFAEDRGLCFLCCHAAKAFGVSAVYDYNARFFLGFKGEFYLNPHGIEPIISRCAISGVVELIKGASPVEAWERMQRKHKHYIEELEEKQDKLAKNWFLGAAILRANMKNATLIVDKRQF